jgi:glucokinase
VNGFPVLIGDIGGTWVRLSVLASADSDPMPVWRAPTHRFATLQDAARDALGRGWPRPRSALLGVAGCVEGPRMRLTNAPWTIDAAEIGTGLGLEGVRLINDYVPMAAAITALDPARSSDIIAVGPTTIADGPRLALGPGTGFGAAALLPAEGRWLVQTSEAGHMSFGACEPADYSLWPRLETSRGRHSVESLLSGPGLLRLYRGIAVERSAAATLGTPAAVTAAAAAGDLVAGAAVARFACLLGRLCGDLALAFGASGGVFLCGGIAPRILPELRDGGFRHAFEDKAPHSDMLRAIPVSVVTYPDPGLLGLTVLARHPERFIIPHSGWKGPIR